MSSTSSSTPSLKLWTLCFYEDNTYEMFRDWNTATYELSVYATTEEDARNKLKEKVAKLMLICDTNDTVNSLHAKLMVAGIRHQNATITSLIHAVKSERLVWFILDDDDNKPTTIDNIVNNARLSCKELDCVTFTKY